MKYKKIMKIAAVATGLTLIGTALTGCLVSQDKFDTQAQELQAVQEQLKEAKADQATLAESVGDATEQLAQKDSKIGELRASLEQYKLHLDEKDKELLAYETSVATKTDLDTRTHTYDELSLLEPVIELVSDRELKGLFDGEVEFIDDNYEAEEFLQLNGLYQSTNREDFGSKSYLAVPDGSIGYYVVFESGFDVSEIDDTDTIEFSFLGEKVEVTEWDTDSITFNRGTRYNLAENQSVTVEGKTVKLITTGDNWVYLSVDGTNKKLWEGDTARVNGIEVKAREVMSATSWRGGVAVLELGLDVEQTVEDGDEYAKDSVWEWAITSNSIGLTLTEEYMDLDDDFKVLAVGDSVCLPTDYLCVGYDGLQEENYHDYTVEFDYKGEVQYVRVKGEFTHGLEDYDRVYLNGTTFLDEDLVPITDGFLQLSDSDNYLTTNGTSLFFTSVQIPYNLSAIYDGAVDISGKDEDYLSLFGIKVSVPEDGVEDKKFRISVPEESVEGAVSVILRK